MDIIIDVTDIVIDTPRLVLRAWRESDLEDFFAYASVPGVGEMAGWPHHETMDTTREILKSFMDGKATFALVERQSSQVIGSLGLHTSWANDDDRYRHLHTKEIGYVLAKEHWGKGLMPEAVQAVIADCFANRDVEALTCGHFLKNSQSKRVIEKCGFSFVKQDTYVSSALHETFDDMKYILLK